MYIEKSYHYESRIRICGPESIIWNIKREIEKKIRKRYEYIDAEIVWRKKRKT